MRALLQLCRDAGIPPIHYHDLCYSAATLLLHAGVDLKTASTMLGHSQITVTADYYSHATSALARSALDRLNRLPLVDPASPDERHGPRSVQRWLRSRTTQVLPHWAHWAVEAPGGRVVVLLTPEPARKGSPLACIYRAARRVQAVLGCPADEALRWVLLGPDRDTWPVGWGSLRTYLTGGPVWVRLTILAGVPTAVVVAVYRQAVEHAARGGHPTLTPARSVDTRTVALARFWHERVERAGRQPTYEALRRDWNTRYPDWRYAHAASFCRALRNSVWAVYRVTPPKRPPRR